MISDVEMPNARLWATKGERIRANCDGAMMTSSLPPEKLAGCSGMLYETSIVQSLIQWSVFVSAWYCPG